MRLLSLFYLWSFNRLTDAAVKKYFIFGPNVVIRIPHKPHCYAAPIFCYLLVIDVVQRLAFIYRWLSPRCRKCDSKTNCQLKGLSQITFPTLKFEKVNIMSHSGASAFCIANYFQCSILCYSCKVPLLSTCKSKYDFSRRVVF